VIRRAVLYLACPDDAQGAVLPVAGRPLASRIVIAAIRAGVTRVDVPAAWRRTALGHALAAGASAPAVVWLEPAAALPGEPVVLLPATLMVPSRSVARVAAAEPTAVLPETIAEGAPLLVADEGLAASLWPPLVAGRPLAETLVRELKGARRAADAASDAWSIRVTDARAARRAESLLYGELGSPIDTRLDTVFHRRLSRLVSRRAVAWDVTPNQISIASLLIGLVAVACFWRATPLSALAGLVLYAAAVVLDHADGEVARLTLTESRLGEWLDVIVDTVVHALLVLAMGVTTAAAAGTGMLLGCIAAGGVVASAAVAKMSPPVAGRGLGAFLDALGSRDGFYAMLGLFIGALVLAPGWLPLLMVVAAAGSHGYWVTRVVYLIARRLA
jgi:phosphatidylglycerophosphate synthase